MNQNTQKEMLREEKEILNEIKKEEQEVKKLSRSTHILVGLIALIIIGAAFGFGYWKYSSGRVYTDKAEVSAPTSDLAPQNSGVLQEVFVKRGDYVNANTVVARVDNELIKTKDAGVVTNTQDSIGKLFNKGEAVVTVVNPDDLRVVGHIDEDKGLSEIKIGQPTTFTVDAFGSKKYEGVVDEISPSARQGDIVFNISDKRETRVFDVKIRFNTTQYPELQNGMSAKLWIYTI